MNDLSPVAERLRAAGATIPGETGITGWPVILDADTALANSLQAYGADLLRLSTELVPLHARMSREGHKVAFGDGEGGVLYALIRALRPRLVFEVSPASGWSTNYILAALTDNAHGEVHSFEIEEHIRGLPAETAIRRNLVASADQSRLTLHIGDATETTGRVEGEIDLLLLDSSHEPAFAEWYTKHLLPRVQGAAVIQDIHFWDRPEPSGEAYYVLDWTQRSNGQLLSVGALERALRADGTPSRWPNPSNAVVALVDGRRLAGGEPSPIALAESDRLEEALMREPQTSASLLRICQLAAKRNLDVLKLAAERLAELGATVPVIEAAKALSAAGLHEDAIAAARAVVASRGASLAVRVGAAEILAAAGRREEASALLARESLAESPWFALSYRYLWRAADVVGASDRGRAGELEHDAFVARPRDRADEEKFFADYLARIRSRRGRPRDVARVAGHSPGRRALFELLRRRRQVP